MKLSDATESIIHEFGKKIVTNAQIVNIFNDYNAFEESKSFKIIIKNLIAEGYMDQLVYVQDWEGSRDRITANFVSATSFDIDNAAYVIQCFGYALGYTQEKPLYTPGKSNSSTSGQTPNTPSPAPNAPQPVPANAPSILDKTESQVDQLSDDDKQLFKETAEAYLNSIVEYKTDFEKELGVSVRHYIEYPIFTSGITPRFEITGKIKATYSCFIMFYVLLYGSWNRLMCKYPIYLGQHHKSFEVGDTFIPYDEYHKISKIKRIVVYWEEN